MSTPQPRKFMFDYDFDQPDHPYGVHVEEEDEVELDEDGNPIIVEEEEEEPPPPTFSEEELNLARDMAYEEGRQQGMAEVMEGTERLTANALAALANQMGQVFRQQEEANDENARNAVRVSMAVLRKMLPAACERHAFDEVTRVVEEVVGHILDEPRIIVRVQPPLVDAVRERLEAACAAHGFEGRVLVQGDGRLMAGDCRVEWTDGGAERDQQRLMQELEAMVERAMAPPERRSDAVAADH